MRRKILTAIALCSIAFAAPVSAESTAPNLPQNRVADSDFKLFNGLAADQATHHYNNALYAIRRCDKHAFDTAMSGLYREASNSDFRSGGNTAIASQLFFGLGITDQDEQDYNTLLQIRGDLRKKWEAAQPCGEEKRALLEQMQLTMQLTAGVMRSLGFSGFLGTENGGGGNRQLDVVKSKDEGSTHGASGELRIPLQSVPKVIPNIYDGASLERFLWDFFFGFAWGNSNVSGALGQFDPNGQTMLFPGIGAGPNPAGFAVAAPNGLVNEMFYEADYDYLSFDLGFGKTFPVNNTRHTRIRPFGGLTYGHMDSFETFSGNVPNVVRRFRYTTEIENRFVGPFLGVEFTTRPDFLSQLLGSDIELNSRLRYSYLFNDADGTDSLAFQGFTPGIVDIGENDETHDVQADIGFTINPDGPVSFMIGGQYHYVGNLPTVMRDGVNVSQIEFENGHSYSGMIRTTFRF